jgi:hypothetical protein
VANQHSVAMVPHRVANQHSVAEWPTNTVAMVQELNSSLPGHDWGIDAWPVGFVDGGVRAVGGLRGACGTVLLWLCLSYGACTRVQQAGRMRATCTVSNVVSKHQHGHLDDHANRSN